MKLLIEQRGDLSTQMEDEIRKAEVAVTHGVRRAGQMVKTAWRDRVVRAGLGRKLPNTIRTRTYPVGGTSISAASIVWSKAEHILGAHAKGGIIRSNKGQYLAIPLPAAGKAPRGMAMTPERFKRRTGLLLYSVELRNGNIMLFAQGRLSKAGRAVQSRSTRGRGVASIPVFLLVRQVRLSKRLDLDSDVERIVTLTPQLILDAWK